MATAVLIPPEISSKHRIPTLDGWRGVAILLVLFGHFSPALWPHQPLWIEKIGAHGVAIFFVLSGFLITTMLDREKQRSGAVDLRRFYLRRFFRLMPSAWCYLGCLAFLNRWTATKLFTATEMRGALFFFRNYVRSPQMFTGHFWSLSIEEQFYLLWPALFLALGQRARWFALAGAAVVAVWRFAHWTELTSQPGLTTLIMTQYRADALLVGCATALFLPTLRQCLRPWMALPLLAGVVACVPLYPYMVPLHESILIALLLAVTSQCSASAFRVLDWKPLVFVGTISYSLYLWQQPLCLLSGHTISRLLTVLGALAILAPLSYYLVEKPGIVFGHKLGKTLTKHHQPPLITTAT